MNSADRPVVVARAASLFRLKPIARALSGLAGMVPVMVWAQLPVGADVVAGAATVTTPDANHMVVQQGSAKTIINWQQFSIGEQGYVQFIQPGASAIALNRVVGADPSAILGKLSANGQVFLVNPNGVFFGAGAKVDVGGIVATTLDIANEDFLDGHFRFKQAPAHEGGATVVNAGVINTAQGGYVVLAGDYAANQGVIQTQAGTALLAAGKALTLQLSGSSLVDFAVDEATVVELAGVENTGQILANGGRVIMTAKVANELAATVVNNKGLVQAQSTVEKNGVVYLVGEGGSVANAGTVDASAQAGANGGYMEMRASGDLVHEAGSRVAVNGADSGASNAGEVYTWADGTNRFKAGAKIEGKGGANGGNGAAVELSGRSVQIAGELDLRAANGQGGSLLIDPLNITITSQDNTAAGGSNVGELWIEGQLNQGTDVTILADGGAGASITLEDLADGVLDGTHVSGTGGSLTLRASGAGSSIVFANTDNTIRVDRNLTLDANNGSGGYAGTSIVAGHLVAGQGTPSGGGHNTTTVWNTALTLDAGDITAESLTLGRTINVNTDSAYTLAARAHSGDLTINGDVNAAVTNSTAAAVATDVTLRADTGAVNVTGNLTSNATGRGYYHYTWQTAGNNAPTYYGAQPWTLNNQGDHAIDAKLNIQAGGNVTIGGAVNVRATDQSSNFAGNGGSFQSPTATQHVFWRATAADAAATITAGGNVGIGGATNVVADGYANASYSETESLQTMVNNYNYTSGSQTVWQYGCPDGDCGYHTSTTYTSNNLKGSATGDYVWSFGPYTILNGSTAYGSASYSTHTDTNSSTQAGPMSYTGQAGLTATLAITAGGDVTLNGIDNRAVNRSNTGTGSYTDTNWAYQDTAGVALSQSNSREINYGDTFTTSFTAAPATASTNISAGDNRSVQLNGGGASYLVEAQHTALTASGNSLAHASMTVTAGSAGGATGNGQITLAGPITVRGASSNEVHLTVTNHDGSISHADSAGTLAVNNQYSSGVARAAFTSNAANIDLGTVTVTAGHTGHFTADADGNVEITSATVSASNTTNATIDAGGTLNLGQATLHNGQMANFTATTGGDIDITAANVTAGNTGNFTATAGGNLDIDSIAVTGTSNNGTITLDADGTLDLGASTITAGQMGTFDAASGGTMDLAGVTINAGHTARIAADSGAALTITGALSATGTRRAEVDIDADGAITLTSGAPISATSNGLSPDGTAAVTIDGLVDVLLNSGVSSSARSTATNQITSGGLLTIGAGTSATATSTAQNATLGLTGGSGLLVNGNATATAAAGIATATVNTSGGSAAGITQASGSTIRANGQSATLTIQAGTTGTINASNAAELNLGGLVHAQAGTGTATLTVNGGDSTLNNFTAASTGNTASAILAAHGTDNALAVTGTGNVTANSNSSGATLAMHGAAGIHAGASAITVRNNSNGASAGASATLNGYAGEVSVGGLQASTAGNGAVSVSVAANGDVAALGAVSAGTVGGNATSSLTSNNGEVSVGSAGSVAATSTSGNASVSLTGATGADMQGNATAQGGGTASLSINGNDGDVATADGTTLTANGATGATLLVSGNSIHLSGDASLSTGLNNASATLTGDGDVEVDGALTVNATTGNATITLDSGAQLTLGSEGDLQALAGGSNATVTLTGTTGMQLDGDALARANAGTATLTAYTDGGSTATVGQGSDSVLRAQGVTTALALGAGNTAASVTGTNAAAFDLQGALHSQASGGTATLTVRGAGGTVNDFSATSTNDIASANIAALVADELLALTGIGNVSGHDNGTNSASLSAQSAGDLDARLASLTVTNTNTGGTAGAGAALNAAGLVQVGDLAVSTAGSETASIAVTGDAVEVEGAVSTTAVAGGSTIDLIALGGDITSTADASLTANAQSGTAAIGLSAVTGIDNQGAISADSTSGVGVVYLTTTGGSTAGITQGTDGSINASGALVASVIIEAGGSLPIEAAQLDLDGSITVDASAGDAHLSIQGSSGRIGAFEVTAIGNASAELTSHTSAGQLVLDGESLVRGNVNNGDGVALLVTAAGSLDAGDADITVSNLNTGADAGATATFDASNGALQLGGVAVSSLGNGLASLGAEATGTLGATNVSASGRTASVTLNGGGNVSLGDVTANASSTASIAATSASGNVTQLTGSDLNATSATGVASIDLDAAGSVELRNANASGVQAEFNAIARNGTLGQAAGATVQANGSAGAAVDLNSTGAMTLNGSVLAGSTGSSANVNLEAAGITQGANGSIAADGTYANATLDASGAVNLGGLLRVDGAYYAAANVEGGSIQLNALDIDSGEDAVATLTSAGGIALNGNATLDGGEAADFTATAQNGALSQAAGASLRASAGVGNGMVTLTSSGAMTLNGSVSSASTHGDATTDLQAASITQGANGSIGASGRFATTALDATGALDLGGLLRANATAGHASVTAQGANIRAHHIDVDATHRASTSLTSTGAVNLTGNATIDGGESADFAATAQNGTLSQTAGAALRAGATTSTASVALNSGGAMALDGSVLATSTHGSATTQLAAASISQGANGSIGANGAVATTLLEATGALNLGGSVFSIGSGSVTTELIAANINLGANSAIGSNGATATTTLDATGALNVDGSVQSVSSSGTATTELTAASINQSANGAIGSNGATAITTLASTGALALDGLLAATGAGNATLTVEGASGRVRNVNVNAGGTAAALIDTSGDLALIDATVNGAQAEIVGNAGGALSVAAGATQQAYASAGAASVALTSNGAMSIDGNVHATSAPNVATVVLNSGTAGLTQGTNSVIGSTGTAASTRITAGGPLALNGLLQLQGGQLAALQVAGGTGNIRNFAVTATNGQAVATINNTGSLVFDGNGQIDGNQDAAAGAALVVNAAGALDTRGATLTTGNANSGAQAGARTVLTSGGELQAGAIAVDAAGGDDAVLALVAGGALQVNTDLRATAHNTGNGHGGALIDLRSGQQGNAGHILQNANSRIVATSGGSAAGDATVSMEAGQCCDGTVNLLGTTTAQVSGGVGDATIRVHGSSVAVQDLTANVNANGQGDTLIALAAPTTVTVNGLLDSQAASAAATAGITLVTNKLDYRATKATLSQGNGRVQLAPFNTTYMIGVESEPDFDATPTVNYDMALLQKFDNNRAQLVFGGEYDRSSWLDESGNSCVPGMAQWQDMNQHTGEIHVAGAAGARLRLAASPMVFDTTGTTYYHDNQMTPWSVPTGRTAIYVPRPTASLDRYLDRTDNSIQTSLFGVESATRTPLNVAPMPAAPENTVPLAGDMFMAGDGVNLSRVDIDGTQPVARGAGAGAQKGGAGSGSAGSSNAGAGSSGSGNAGTGGTGAGKAGSANSGSANSGSADSSADNTNSRNTGPDTGKGAATEESTSDSSRPDGVRGDDEDDDDNEASEA